jgi:hypothetical protein
MVRKGAAAKLDRLGATLTEPAPAVAAPVPAAAAAEGCGCS